MATERRNDLVRYGASRTGMYDQVEYPRTASRPTLGGSAESETDEPDDVTPLEHPTPPEPASTRS